MSYNQKETYDAYSMPDTFVIGDIDKIVDSMVAEYLVYKCNKCGAVDKYTFREIEKVERKKLSKFVIDIISKGELRKSAVLKPNRPRVLVYCGKCGGLDGKGSCLKEDYEKCELKRLPDV